LRKAGSDEGLCIGVYGVSSFCAALCARDDDDAAIYPASVECSDGVLCFVVVGHINEGKAERASIESIADDTDGADAAERGECVLQIIFGGVERQIADIDVHVASPVNAFWRALLNDAA